MLLEKRPEVSFCITFIHSPETNHIILGSLSHHIPNLESFDDLLILFTLANAMELLNVVDFQTYFVRTNMFDIDSSDKADPGVLPLLRLQYIDARKKSRELLQYFFSHYELVNQANAAVDGPSEVFYPYLAQQSAALINMKRQAVKEKIGGALDCTMSKAQQEINLCFLDSPVSKIMADLKNADNFLWNRGVYTVRPLSAAINCNACKFTLLDGLLY